VVNFVLLAAVLWYFLYEPVLRIINERKDKIARGVQDAKDAHEIRRNAEDERLRFLEKANDEATTMTANAKTYAKEQADEIVRSAEEKAASLADAAAKRGEELKERMRREAEEEVAQTAVLAAEKILRERNV
jgi:F-type H+-transporting ATPase subunit b